MRHFDDPVDVRTGPDREPAEFLWRGGLWQVREVVAQWAERTAWWHPAAEAPSGPAPAGPTLTDPVVAAAGRSSRGGVEVWRVRAARGRLAWLDGERELVDLAVDGEDGSWRLARAAR